jgi:hypothetical protein
MPVIHHWFAVYERRTAADHPQRSAGSRSSMIERIAAAIRIARGAAHGVDPDRRAVRSARGTRVIASADRSRAQLHPRENQ